MQIEWLGQSAFRLAADDATVVIDPSADVDVLAAPLTIVPAAP
jgi:L-ascorbate metabolism protein UlaG (beta-lactamase superfamily)